MHIRLFQLYEYRRGSFVSTRVRHDAGMGAVLVCTIVVKKNTGTVVGQCRRRLSGAVVLTPKGPSFLNSGQDKIKTYDRTG